MPWLGAHRCLVFDTVDGDLHRGQFARRAGHILVRLHPESNRGWSAFEEGTYDVTALTEVAVLPGLTRCYAIVALPDGRPFRFPITAREFADYSQVKNHPRPVVVKTDAEVAAILLDHDQWP